MRTLVLALFALSLGVPAPARADLEAARLRNELGIVYVKDGHLEDGLRNFSLILAEFPEEAAALNNAANVYFLQGEMDRARDLYERAVAVAPNEGGIRLNLGILLHAVGEDDAAAAAVRQGLARIGDLQHAYFLLGLSSQQMDRVRASESGDVEAAEIEELLARAMAEVPTVSPEERAGETEDLALDDAAHRGAEASPDSVEQVSRTVQTRPGGAKAAQAGTDSDRLFWMTLATHP
jgi:Tfp pilus assembly protein PilF